MVYKIKTNKKKKSIEHYEKEEDIHNQKVISLGKGKYIHIEEVTYPKHKK